MAAAPALAQRHADLVYLQQAKQKAQTTAAAKSRQEQAQNAPAPNGTTKPAAGQTSGSGK
ncbi:hypothetical protein CAP39_14960 [Sphingomonas sp. IBVSS1]|nr:hypothetical protein CAP39_14960 [Sphingomonas sp. IBVSS1]